MKNIKYLLLYILGYFLLFWGMLTALLLFILPLFFVTNDGGNRKVISLGVVTGLVLFSPVSFRIGRRLIKNSKLSKEQKGRFWRYIFGGLFLWFLGLVIFIGVYEDRVIKKIDSSVDPDFPVLVLLKQNNDSLKPSIVFYKDLQDFLETNPEYTFYIPVDKKSDLNWDLRLIKNPAYDSVDFNIENTTGNKQFVEIKVARENRYYESRYESTNVEIVPKYYGESPRFWSDTILPLSATAFSILVLVFTRYLFKRKIVNNKSPVL